MSHYPKVTEKDLIDIRKRAKQEKNQRATKSENRIFKQTHEKTLAKSLSPIVQYLEN